MTWTRAYKRKVNRLWMARRRSRWRQIVWKFLGI
jgi:hypothetical protein